MKPKVWLAAVTAFSKLGVSEVLDLGSLDQYGLLNIDKNPPYLDDNGLGISKTDGGYNLTPGKSFRERLQDAADKCAQIDDSCYNELSKASSGMYLQTDPELESKQAPSFLSLFKWGSFFLTIIHARLKNKPEEAIGAHFVPYDKATTVSVFVPGATVTVSGDGSAIATVTEPPETMVQASATPTVVRIEQSKDGFETGDFDLQFEEVFAQRLNEYINRFRSIDCADAETLRNQGQTKRGDAQLAISPSALCTTEKVLEAAVPGALFQDLLVMDTSKFHIDLADTVAKGAQAVAVLSQFIKSRAGDLRVSAEVGEQIGLWTLIMIAESLRNNVQIGAHTRVKADLLVVEDDDKPSETKTSGSCPEPTKLVCGMKNEDCPLELKKTSEGKKTVCKDGDHKDCECVSGGISSVKKMPIDMQMAFLDIINRVKPGSLEEGPKPDCPDKASEFQSAAFYSDQRNVFGGFCDKWKKEENLEMTVNGLGEEQKSARRLRVRTPPPNLDSMKEWRVDLKFTTSDKGESCWHDCKDAFKTIANSCTGNGAGSFMQEKGSLDVGCGSFSYSVYQPNLPVSPPPPPPPPENTWEKKFDRNGSPICGGPLLKVKDCDHAVNYLHRGTGNKATTYSTGYANCWADIAGDGCGVMIEGQDCTATGADMWDWYQELRKSGSSKCGRVEYSEGCFFKVDYVTGCNNH